MINVKNKKDINFINGLKRAVDICNKVYCTGSTSIDECINEIEKEVTKLESEPDKTSYPKDKIELGILPAGTVVTKEIIETLLDEKSKQSK